MPTLNARLITRNDWDFNWQQSDLVLQPGELAVSIPTRLAENGDPIIAGTGTVGDGARTPDTNADMIIKIGNSDKFYNSNGVPNGSAGVLVNLGQSGSFDPAADAPVTFSKDPSTGKTIITVREASATYSGSTVASAKSGVLAASDYKDMRTAMDFMRDPSIGQVTRESIRDAVTAGVITDVTIQKDSSTGELGVSGNIIWNCQGALQN